MSDDGVLRRRVLITGCGRSGTKHIAFVLRRLGLDVRHERLGRDGVAAWTMAVADVARPYGPSVRVAFDHVFHQVRHPLAAIASATTFSDASWSFICAHTRCDPDEPVLVRAARYWLEWNEHAARVATWRYRIEALPEVLPELCERLGARCDHGVLARVPRDVNTRRRTRAVHVGEELLERLHLDMPATLRTTLERIGHAAALPKVTWDDLERHDRPLAREVRAVASRYGYTT